MKILMTTMGLDIGGAETHIVELALELKRMGHDIAIASNGGVYVREIEEAGIRHYSVPMNRRSVIPMLKSFIMLRKIIRREKPDVVHAHSRIPAFLCGILRKIYKFPFVTTAHWVFDTGGALRFLTNWGEKTLSVSEDIKEYLEKNYCVEGKDIIVTINGIDTDKFSPDISGDKVKAELGIERGAVVITHVSRLDESRALAARCLIDIAEKLSEEIPGAVVIIAGDGDRFAELSEKAAAVNEKLGYRCVIMTGARTDINEIVAAGDIFVGVSRAALEAMSASKPVLLAGNEGYMGIFSEDRLDEAVDTNFCCRGCGETEDGKLLRDISGMMEMPEEERKKLGESGRRIIRENYSVSRMAEDAVKAYKSVLPPRRIVASGYYGFGNAGDEAILQSVYGSISGSIPNVEITVLSRTPEETSRTYGCRAVSRFNPVSVTRSLRKCTALVFGGGSLLQDTTSTRSLLYYITIIRSAERMGKKVMLYANGIGPIRKESSRRRTAEVVNAATAVTLRDEDSVEELRSMGVTRDDMVVTADPVFLMEPAGMEAAEKILRSSGVPEGEFAAVSVRPWKNADFERKIAEICDRVHERTKLSVLFVPMQPQTDEEECGRIAGLMKYPSYMMSRCTAAETMAVIGMSSLVFSMRLHSLIFAARMAVPAIGFDYDPKLASYLRMLELPSAGTVDNIDIEGAVGYAEDILQRRDLYVEKLNEKRVKLASEAAENNSILSSMLENS